MTGTALTELFTPTASEAPPVETPAVAPEASIFDDLAKEATPTPDLDITKTDEATSPDDKPQEESKEEIDYGDFTVEDGVTLDDKTLSDFKELAKGLSLKKEDAQKVVDMGVAMAKSWAEKQQAQMTETVASWKKEVVNDKEVGGQNVMENIQFAKTALKQFGTPELSKVLQDSGLVNHPEVVRVFCRVGKQISNDTIITGRASVEAPTQSAAEILFGKK